MSNELDAVVIKYSSYVQAIAVKLHKSLNVKVDLQDLVSYGNVGLLEAWARYDANSRAAFTSFAYHRIRGAMIDGCRTEGWIGRDRSKEAKAARVVNGYMGSHTEANMEAPAPTSFADALSRVERTVSGAVTVLLVEAAELEQIQGAVELDPLASLEKHDLERRLHAAIQQVLTEEERDILLSYHFSEESLTSIGQRRNMSTSWVSRIHSRAIDKLRDALLAEEALPPLGALM